MDPTKAEDIKKRWPEYTEALYKKMLLTHIATMVWSHTEANILECEVKSTLENKTTKKASEGNGFQILKGDAVKMLHSMCQQIWKTQQWPWVWKM